MSRPARHSADLLRITEIFYSLQGEARTAGRPTVFIRLTGCPLRCRYCDTGYAFFGGEMRRRLCPRQFLSCRRNLRSYLSNYQLIVVGSLSHATSNYQLIVVGSLSHTKTMCSLRTTQSLWVTTSKSSLLR